MLKCFEYQTFGGKVVLFPLKEFYGGNSIMVPTCFMLITSTQGHTAFRFCEQMDDPSFSLSVAD